MAGAKNRFGFTEEEMESLTDAERAAIMDEDTLEPEDIVGTGELEEDAGEADPAKEEPEEDPKADEPKDKEEPEEEPKPAEEAKPQDPAAPAGREASAAEPEKPAAPAATPAPTRANPVPRYQVPQNADAQLKGFDDNLDELAQKFDDGEIMATEMRQQQRQIEKQRDELREQMMLAKVAQGFTVSQWTDHEVPTFLAAHPEYEPGTLRYKMLDQLVREQQTANPGNEFDPSFLTNAHEQIQQEMGGTARAAPAKPAVATEPRAALPPTLRGVPAADISPAADGGKFAALDRLATEDLEAFESKLAAMSEDERDRYLQANT